MRRHLLIIMMMLCGGTLSSSAIDWGGTKSALDTMVNAKIVKWNKVIAADTLPMKFYSVANSYSGSIKPDYTAITSGKFDISNILGGASNDTLSITRIDNKAIQYVAEDTAYFMGPLDATRQMFKDSIFVTRLSHYLYVQADDNPHSSNLTKLVTISVKDAGTLKIYAVSDAKYGGQIWFTKQADEWDYSENLFQITRYQATVNWNNFGESVVNYNLSNPQANKSGSYYKSTSTEPKDTTLNCYEIHYISVEQGEYTLGFSQNTKIYGIELVRANAKQAMINFPESGLDNLELENVEVDMEELEADSKLYTVLVLEDRESIIKVKPADGHFKKGDVVTLAGAYLANSYKTAKIDILGIDGYQIYTTEQLVNGRTDPSPPKIEHYTIAEDRDYIMISTSWESRTTVYLTKLQVTRASELDQSYREAPKIVSKVVRWSETAATGKLADSYLSVDNPYVPAPISIASIFGYNKGPASSDTLQLTRTDADKVQSLICDTVYFRSSVDPCSNHYRDSIYVTRFTHYLNTAAPSGERNRLKLKLMTEGTLKIFARPVNGTAADRTIIVTQGNREVINASLPADGNKDVVNVNTAAFSSVNNYNLANPPQVVSYNIGGKGNKETNTPADVDVYPVLYARVDAGELTIEYPVGAVEIYGVELVIIDQSGLKTLIDFPDDSTDGLYMSSAVTMEEVTTKSGKTKKGFKLGDFWKRANVRLYLGDDFKRGDVIKIGGFTNESSGGNTGRLMLFSLEGGSDPTIHLLTDPLVNVKTDDGEEFIETVTLTDDYPALWVARPLDCKTTCYLSVVKVLGKRDNDETAQIRAYQRENKSGYYDDEATGIGDTPVRMVTHPTADIWYTLDGRRLIGFPAVKGLYLHNGQKVIVK